MAISDIFKVSQYQETIRKLENENHSLEFRNQNNLSTIQDLESKANEFQAEIAELQAEIAELQKFIHTRLPLFETTSLPAFNNFEALQELWYKCWGDIDHNSLFKLARQERACKSYLTPLDLDARKGVAHLRGEEQDYKTTLNTCECMDFQRHALPCKHMYRLAYELDIFMLDGTVETVPDPDKLLHQNDFDFLLQRLTENDRKLISLLTYHPHIVSRTDARRLLDLGLIAISSNKYSLLDHYKRDELFALLPSDSSVKKSCKKADLIKLIISTYPNVITQIEKLTIPVELSPYVARFQKKISRLGFQQDFF